MDQELADYADHDPEPKPPSGEARVVAAALLSAFGCFALGVLATVAISQFATRDLGAARKSDVIMHWYGGGALASAVTAAVVAGLYAWWTTRRVAP